MGQLHPKIDWRRAHEALTEHAKTRSGLDAEEGPLLLDALRAGTHLRLGFATFAEYVERILGYKPRWTEERLRVAEALESLPKLAAALREGAIHWSVARELTRVAAADNEDAWLEVSRGRTARQVEELVAGHRLGDEPDNPFDASIRKHVLRFEVSADTLATFREALAKVRRDAATLDDDAALLLVARQVLGGPSDTGRSTYQVALTVCPTCERGWQQGHGADIEVDSHVIEMARCDAQNLPDPVLTHVGATKPGRARQGIPPAIRRVVLRRHGGRCVVPGCKNASFVDVHHLELRSEGGTHDPDTMVVLCGAHHRAEHRGQLVIEGRVSTGLVFRHADGSGYGTNVDPHAAALHTDVFRALRGLGFKEREAHAALERARRRPEAPTAGFQGLLREALASAAPW